ncbi:unnamed protein product (macronuclear) [Paramecium tetraurelia]|uniref:TNFR-Cys domain-containing protein n=1 Tax=Paramecium tetraurelia TaxID=5888 RepID=A0DA31_PARTE|nr:uncharacterized protein GSPATT00039348001 [Paramecium tetraurelia]CAK79898.1 unnamed protein product [Paramecium tetraurelia]|eukprot:XP_001447295.1 hypothetical protein (macronuclear) [Paramecium tetraurelia strain d4-2]
MSLFLEIQMHVGVSNMWKFCLDIVPQSVQHVLRNQNVLNVIRVITYQNKIAFIFVFGPQFKEDGKFILYLDDSIYEVTKSSAQKKIFKNYQHSQSTLKIDWECQGLSNEPIEAYCGLYQFYTTIHYCRPECQACINEIDCQDSTTNVLKTCSQLNEYYDWQQNECLCCPSTCETCTSLQNCLTCKNGFVNPIMGCICPPNYFYNKNQQECIQCSQKCDKCINEMVCTQCDLLKFRMLINNQCICRDGYYEQQDTCLECVQFCRRCSSQSDCQECIQGFMLNNLDTSCQMPINQYYVTSIKQFFACPTDSFNTQCICGDGIITQAEECDDANIEKNDGCYECKLEGQPQCTKCIRGICYECMTPGWYLNLSTDLYVCQEQCSSICKNCQFYCRPDCLECDYDSGYCLMCREGLKSVSNYCTNICGDGVIANAPDVEIYEQCDDANLNDDNDGCSSNCRFKCQSLQICDNCLNNRCLHCVDIYKLNQKLHRCECRESCLICDFSGGNGCLQCRIGYELRDKQCFTVCGDQIVTPDEECDDGNLTFGDG